MRRTVPIFFAFVSLLVLGAAIASPATPDAPPSGWVGVFLGGDDAPAGDAPSEAPRGVRVRAVVEGSPAEGARLRASDRIVAVDGVAVLSVTQVLEQIRRLEPDSTVSLTLLRGEEEIGRMLRIGTRPTDLEGLRPIEGWIGIEAISIPASLRVHFGAPETAGILVSQVAEGSPAEAAGIRIGDVIFEIAGEPVSTLGGLAGRLTESGVDNSVEIGVARDGARLVLAPEIARRPERPSPGEAR